MSAKVSVSSPPTNASILKRLADVEAWMKSAGEKNKALEARCIASERKVASLEMANKELREELCGLKKGAMVAISGRRDKNSKRIVAPENQARDEDVVEEGDNDGDEQETPATELSLLKKAQDAYVIVTIFHTYSYSFMQFVGAATTLLTVCSLHPVTKWDAEEVGVPVVDEGVRVRVWAAIGVGSWSVGAMFNVLSDWESGVRVNPVQAAWPAAPICLLSGFFSLGLVIGAMDLALTLGGVDFSYYGNFSIILLGIGVIMSAVIAPIFMHKAYFEWDLGPDHPVRDTYKMEQRGAGQNAFKIGGERRRRTSVMKKEMRKIRSKKDRSIPYWSIVILTLGVAINILAYPTLIVPFFNADTTSDAVRVAVLTIILSIVTETTLMIMRCTLVGVGENFYIKTSVSKQNIIHFFEVFSILARRLLLGCMAEQRSVYTVSLCGGCVVVVSLSRSLPSPLSFPHPTFPSSPAYTHLHLSPHLLSGHRAHVCGGSLASRHIFREGAVVQRVAQDARTDRG